MLSLAVIMLDIFLHVSFQVGASEAKRSEAVLFQLPLDASQMLLSCLGISLNAKIVIVTFWRLPGTSLRARAGNA